MTWKGPFFSPASPVSLTVSWLALVEQLSVTMPLCLASLSALEPADFGLEPLTTVCQKIFPSFMMQECHVFPSDGKRKNTYSFLTRFISGVSLRLLLDYLNPRSPQFYGYLGPEL